MGVELLHVDRQTDMKLIVAFRNFANAPKNRNYVVNNLFVAYGGFGDFQLDLVQWNVPLHLPVHVK